MTLPALNLDRVLLVTLAELLAWACTLPLSEATRRTLKAALHVLARELGQEVPVSRRERRQGRYKRDNQS